jgi:hypothetical protein
LVIVTQGGWTHTLDNVKGPPFQVNALDSDII